MAQPNLESFTKRGLALKIEVTEGTDANPVPGTDGFFIMNGSSGTEFDKVERPIDRPHFTNTPFAVANKRAFIEGDMEIHHPDTPGAAAGAGLPHQDPALRIAGMTAVLDDTGGTTIYNPISTGISSATAYWWHVNQHLKILGARANITGLRMTIGEIVQARLRLQGSYDAITKEALPSITLPGFIPETVQADNSELLINCSSASITDLVGWGKELSIDFGNSLTTKEFTSKKVNSISDRLGTWTLRMAAADLADFNPWTVRDSGYIFEAKLTQTYSGVAQHLGIRGQIESITDTDIDGDLGWELSGPCVASDAGGDEFELGFADSP